MPSLSDAVATLDRLAPLRHAAKWDNVGLLVAPVSPRPVTAAHLTIDLTAAVYAEARAAGAELIVAYHPPVFGGLKRLTPDRPLTRVLLQALHDRVAIYSPHTALDAVVGGVNDWLLEGLGAATDVRPIEPATDPDAPPGTGMGRVATLSTPLAAAELVPTLKAWLGLSSFRVAWAPAHKAGAPMARVAVCPGAGGSLFESLRGPIDLLVTGELRHHDILARVATGTTVVVTDHTNTERGFLPRYAKQLRAALPDVAVTVSAVDADPLQVV